MTSLRRRAQRLHAPLRRGSAGIARHEAASRPPVGGSPGRRASLQRRPPASNGLVAWLDQLAQQDPHLFVDLVDDRPHDLHGLASWVVELPVEVPLGRVERQASPQPMVTMTSAARAASSLRSFGNSLLGSSPRSSRTATTLGLSSAPGCEPAERTSTRPRA